MDCNRPCPCGQSPNFSYWLTDARGIPVARVCDSCVERIKARFRPEIFADPQYVADEPIDPEDDNFWEGGEAPYDEYDSTDYFGELP